MEFSNFLQLIKLNHQVLDNIIVVKAFTFYQLANIIINEIPKFMDKMDCQIQILAIDVLDTLFKKTRKLVKLILKNILMKMHKYFIDNGQFNQISDYILYLFLIMI